MKKMSLVAAIVMTLSGCSSIQLSPGATHVIASPNAAPKACHYVGQVIGNQGNFFTGAYTSNRNLEIGAMNDMKNQASTMGANYVQIITNRAGMTSSIAGSADSNGAFMSGSTEQTNVTNVGNAYSCPPHSIGL